jgi:hypothetical protein
MGIQMEQECAICMELLDLESLLLKLECGHEFHEKCMKSWMEKGSSCPMCRASTGDERSDRERTRDRGERNRVCESDRRHFNQDRVELLCWLSLVSTLVFIWMLIILFN